ncbi:MAG: carbon-nitrogen hydrolase family protein [Phycisphaerales bacterium JB063]
MSLRYVVGYVFVVAVLMLWLLGVPDVGRGSAAASDPAAGQTVRIAVCQTLCIDSDPEGNLRRVAYALADAADQGAQIACFPETAVLGWVNPDAHALAHPIPGPTTDHLAALAVEHGMMICIGLCEKDGEDLYDSAVLISAQGEILAVHRKVNCLPGLMDPPYQPGGADGVRVVDTEFGRVGMLICADTFEAELLEAAKAQSPDLMLVPYGWAAGKGAWPEHGESLLACVSHVAERLACPVVGCNSVGSVSSGPWRGFVYGGQSPVAGAGGEPLGVLRDRQPEVRVFEVELNP